MKTPTTPEGLTQYDHLPPHEAVRKAWTDAGKNPPFHFAAKQQVAATMPVLARALERLARETK